MTPGARVQAAIEFVLYFIFFFPGVLALIYAGIDYEAILRQAENDPDGCDIILWDGGNNDFPFYVTDFAIVVADPHRPGHELCYHPG